MIPKRIFTVWLGNEPPDLVKRCIGSQTISGYEHRLITLDNKDEWKGFKFVDEAINAKKWAKAADFLRMFYLYHCGGIYLDADMEVLATKNFDHLLNLKAFACREDNGFIANSAVGAESGHPLLANYLKLVEENFRGDGEMVFELGMKFWTELIHRGDPWEISILSSDYFFPYNHQTNQTKITQNTLCYHHFIKSWLPT